MLPGSRFRYLSALSARPPLRLVAAVSGTLLLLGSACATADAEDPNVAADAASEEAAASRENGAGLVALGPPSGPVRAGEPDDATEPDETPPGLVILSKAKGSTVDDSRLVFSGFSEPGATVTAGESTTVTGEDGRWHLELSIEAGQDTAVVVATDAEGNEFKKEVTVKIEEPKPVAYEPPKEKPIEQPKEEHKPKPEIEKPAPEKEPQHEFTAWTKFGICTEHPVEKTGGEGSKDNDVLTKFKGSGIPGTAVIVTSEFGEGITEVNDDGYWWIQIEFEAGAAEAEFTARVTNGDHAAFFRCGLI